MFRAAVVLALISLVVGGSNAQDNDRIIGGKSAMISDCPCVVSLQVRDIHKCGGTILTPRIILTAAHCYTALAKQLTKTKVRSGASMYSTGGTLTDVLSIVKHPKYNATTKENDFALIKLKGFLEFDVSTKPCELATKIPAHGRSSLICGWGLKKETADIGPNMLQKANVSIISREKCTTEFGYREDEILPGMMCAGDKNIDSCQGDSGGPIITGDFVTGVTSFGKGCGHEKYPGVYATVTSVKNWIKKTIETM